MKLDGIIGLIPVPSREAVSVIASTLIGAAIPFFIVWCGGHDLDVRDNNLSVAATFSCLFAGFAFVLSKH